MCHYLSWADAFDLTLSVCVHTHACESVCVCTSVCPSQDVPRERSLLSQHSRSTHRAARPNQLSSPALLTGLVGKGELPVGAQ